MIQAVITPEHRGGLGMHYTSVPNIMKVIEPLFLDDLKEAYQKAKGNSKKVSELLNRLHNIKIFDPACGSGNFLIIAYKELRKLEMQIFKESGMMALSGIALDQFYGIELDDFAHEIAQLSLWLAEHQMNTEFFNEFGQTNPTLPLKEAGQIVLGNACRINWELVCPKKKNDEIYILGNPPYLGSKEQNDYQKKDMNFVFRGWGSYKKLDYIACWYKLAADFSSGLIRFCFVSTNSICQGEQVALIWPYIFELQKELFFAHTSFHWSNNAKDKAGVTVVITGVKSASLNDSKTLFYGGRVHSVSNISPYLTNSSNTIIYPRSEPLSSIPSIIRGSQPTDNGNLIFSTSEKNEIVRKFPAVNKYIKRYIGADDYINNKTRFCLWIGEENIKKIVSIPPILERLENCRQFRLNSKKASTRKKADVPYLFDEIKHRNSNSVIFPIITSHRRIYVPIGFLTSEVIVSNKAQVVYDAEPMVFGLLTSKMHMSWMKITSSRMRKDYQYSSRLSYNTFPFPPISDQLKQEITQCVFRILEEREKSPEKTLGQLYDPDKMPEGLREAHHQNDLAVERCYRSKPFESDEERLEYLFKLYERMIEEEKSKGGLFEKPKKRRR